MSFRQFRENFLSAVLDLLWAQWSALGVAGYSRELSVRTRSEKQESEKADGSADLRGDCIDPETLIIASSLFGRFDQRLFDCMLGWLLKHDDLISAQRLSSLVENDFPDSADVMKAIASFLLVQGKKQKWRSLTGNLRSVGETRPLFSYPSGLPVEFFGQPDPLFLSLGFSRGQIEKKSQLTAFQKTHPASLWLRLRAFMGVSGRTDVLMYLITHRDGGHASLIARVLGYAQRGIHQILVSMYDSGWTMKSERKKEIVYALAKPIREAFTSYLESAPYWVTWSLFFRGMKIVWRTLSETRLFEAPTEVQAAELREAMRQAIPDLSLIGFAPYFLESQNKKGRDYLQAMRMEWSSLFNDFHGETNAPDPNGETFKI